MRAYDTFHGAALRAPRRLFCMTSKVNDPAPPPLTRAGIARFDAPSADFDALRVGAVHARWVSSA